MKIKRISIDASQRKAIFESAGKDSGLTLEAVNALANQIEASMNAKIIEVGQALKTEATKALNEHKARYRKLAKEAVSRNNSRTLKQVDMYLEYAVKEFFKKNALAIESSISAVRDRRLVEGFISLMKENYFQIPAGKEDVIKEMGRYAAKLENLAESKNAQYKQLAANFVKLKKNAMVESAARKLTDTQRAKLFEWSKNFKGAKNTEEFKSALLEARKAIVGGSTLSESSSGVKATTAIIQESPKNQSFAPLDDLVSRSLSVLGR